MQLEEDRVVNRVAAPPSDVLLARINRQLEAISDAQHRLARRKALFQEQATRLRLGASPVVVQAALAEASAFGDEPEVWGEAKFE
jgi:hypothetical protein